MPLYDFTCPSGHTVEKLAAGEVRVIPCPVCGGNARRVGVCNISFRFAPVGESQSRRYKRYQEASAELDYTCTKFESETNAKVPDLGLWQEAKNEAYKRK